MTILANIALAGEHIIQVCLGSILVSITTIFTRMVIILVSIEQVNTPLVPLITYARFLVVIDIALQK